MENQDPQVTKQRLEKITAAVATTPEQHRHSVISGFSRLQFENDAEFDGYLAAITTSAAEYGKNTRSSLMPQAPEKGEEIPETILSAINGRPDGQPF